MNSRLFLMLTMAGGLFHSQGAEQEWNRPFPPHHVIGNVYYVGSSFLASFLITTPEGHILINSGTEETVPLIQLVSRSWALSLRISRFFWRATRMWIT